MAANEGIAIDGTNVLDELFGADATPPAVEETPPAAGVEKAPEPAESAALETVGTEDKPAEQAKIEEPAKQPEGEAKAEVGQKKEAHVPIAVVTELREDRRNLTTANNELQKQLAEAKINEARLQGQLEMMAKMQSQKPAQQETAKVVEQSPLEKFIEEFPDDPAPAKVLLEQRRWEQAQQDQQAKQVQTQSLEQQIADGITEARNYYSADRVGSAELSLDSVVALAQSNGLITDQDKMNLGHFGKRAGMMLYDMAKSAIQQAGGAPLQELNRRVLAARQTLVERANASKPKQQPKPAAAPAKPAEPPAKTAKTEDEGDFSEISNFLFS